MSIFITKMSQYYQMNVNISTYNEDTKKWVTSSIFFMNEPDQAD